MKSQTSNSKYSLLVLIDKSKASHSALKNAINLAKLIDGSIDLLQVKPPSSVVENENQIAAIRNIAQQQSKDKKELMHLVSSMSNEIDCRIKYHFTYGNVKNEVKKHIAKINPDIVVLGKRKKKMVDFLGDQLTNNLLKTHNKGLLICGSTEAFISDNSKSIGFLNDIDGLEKMSFNDDIKSLTEKPLKVFKTKPESFSSETEKNITTEKKAQYKKDTVVFEFDSSNNTANDMTDFISKNNLSLLCVTKKDINNPTLLKRIHKILNTTIEKTNVPVLVLNQN